MNECMIVLLIVSGTVASYFFSQALYKHIKITLLIPVVVATALIIITLLLFNISYETYMIGGKWIHLLLGPAVVSLAYPLYEQRHLLKRLAFPILCGSLTGAVLGIVTGLFFARLFELDDELIYSVIPKSVTTPVAMDVSESLGGISSLAAVFVIIAGVFGAVFGRLIFHLFKLKKPVAKGVALGSASHAIGTAYAFEHSELEGSISTIAMIVSAVFVSILAPSIVQFFM